MNAKKLYNFTVKDICDIFVSTPSTISPDAPIEKLFKKMIENPITRHTYLVDEKGTLLGSVRLKSILDYLTPHLKNVEIDDIRDLLTYFFNDSAETAKDLCSNCGGTISVTMDSSIEAVLKLMHQEEINELPIVDNENRVIGEVNMLEIIAALYH